MLNINNFKEVCNEIGLWEVLNLSRMSGVELYAKLAHYYKGLKREKEGYQLAMTSGDKEEIEVLSNLCDFYLGKFYIVAHDGFVNNPIFEQLINKHIRES